MIKNADRIKRNYLICIFNDYTPKTATALVDVMTKV